MKKPERISIVISFYERLEHLRCCLDALGLCRSAFDDVTIADDGSGRRVVEQLTGLIATYDFPIRHVWHEKKGWRPAASRNMGIRSSTGDYIVFLDCDFLVLPDTVTAHLAAALPGRFVAGGCKYLTEEQTRTVFETPIRRAFLEDLDRAIPGENLLAEHRKFTKRTLLFRLRLENRRKQSLGGHFSLFRNDIVKVNGFDENFVGWGGEDEDLGIRLVKAGVYGRSAIPHARVMHMWHPKALSGKDWRDGPNIDYFKRRHIVAFCENGLIKPGRRK